MDVTGQKHDEATAFCAAMLRRVNPVRRLLQESGAGGTSCSGARTTARLTAREAVVDATAARQALEGACVAIRLGVPERGRQRRPVVDCGQFGERQAKHDRNDDGQPPYDQLRQVQAHPVAAMRAAPRNVIEPIAASRAMYERGCVFTHEI
jgi:hypothetical protein